MPKHLDAARPKPQHLTYPALRRLRKHSRMVEHKYVLPKSWHLISPALHLLPKASHLACLALGKCHHLIQRLCTSFPNICLTFPFPSFGKTVLPLQSQGLLSKTLSPCTSFPKLGTSLMQQPQPSHLISRAQCPGQCQSPYTFSL